MSEVTNTYHELHVLTNHLPRLSYPYQKQKENGLYIMFEKGERYKGMDRIVWVGTHQGNNSIYKKLDTHFGIDQRQSMLRRHIGRCFLCKEGKEWYLPVWDCFLRSTKAKQKNSHKIDWALESELEEHITAHLQAYFSFAMISGIADYKQRMRLKQGIIATLAQSSERMYSKNWLGKWHPSDKATSSKLWNITHHKAPVLTQQELIELKEHVSQQSANNTNRII